MSAVSDARATLLRALDNLEAAENELDGQADRCDLVVVYSIGHDLPNDEGWQEIGGWAATSGPRWLHAAMLRRAATAQDDQETDPPDED